MMKTILLISVLLLFAIPLEITRDNVSHGAEKNTPAEAYVLEKLSTGELADLKERFSTEDQRVLDSSFIVALLTGKLEGVIVQSIGVRIGHAVFNEHIDLTNSHISLAVELLDCRFENGVTLKRSIFSSVLVLDGSQFKGSANFESMKVGGSAFFDDAKFQGPVSFWSADIGGILTARRAEFTNPDKEANFNSIKIGGSAFFDDAEFQGPVNFVSAKIGSTLEARRVEFTNPDKEANFNSMKVGGSAFFHEAKFEGAVNFGYVESLSNFEALAVTFTNRDEEANFDSMKVGNHALFNGAEFEGPVDFGHVEIGRNLVANRTKFANPEKKANFNSMKVGHSVFFRDAEFQGPVDFVSADIGSNFEAHRAKFTNREREADFNSMKVGNHAFFDGVEFQGAVDFGHVDIGRFGGFNDAKFGGRVSFSYAKFFTLSIHNASWPDSPNSILMDAIDYQQLLPKSWNYLLEWIGSAKFHPEAYTELDNFAMRQGNTEMADRIYVAHKRRVRHEYLQWRKPLRWKRVSQWLWNVFLDWTLLYGRSPERIFWFCGIFVVISGLFVFRPRKMEQLYLADSYSRTRKKADASPDRVTSYNAFWYSLDLLLPVIDLQVAKRWAPKEEHRCLTHYARVLIIVGWILIPIGLAAVTGIIK